MKIAKLINVKWSNRSRNALDQLCEAGVQQAKSNNALNRINELAVLRTHEALNAHEESLRLQRLGVFNSTMGVDRRYDIDKLNAGLGLHSLRETFMNLISTGFLSAQTELEERLRRQFDDLHAGFSHLKAAQLSD